MGALPNVASSRRYQRTDWQKEKEEQGAKLGLDGWDRITEGIVTRMGGDARGDHGRSLSEAMARLRAQRA